MMDIEDMINQINLSDLSSNEKESFKDWLGERPHMQTNIKSTLRKGQSVSVSIGKKVYGKPVDYFIHIQR